VNSEGGPWAFWIEMKGHLTKIKRTPAQVDNNRAGYQAQWAYRTMAAGVPVFLLRNSSQIKDVLELVGFPHRIHRKMGIDQSLPVGEQEVMLEFIGASIRTMNDRENEGEVQTIVSKILKSHSFSVTDTSQGYRPGGARHGTTRITLGTPDLYVTRVAIRPRLWLPSEIERVQ